MRRPCFIHLPKCAGTSIKAILLRHYGAENCLEANSWYPLSDQLTEEPEAFYWVHAFMGHLRRDFFNGFPHEELQFFSVVREPVSRVVSEYLYIRRTEDHVDYEIVRDLHFEDWVQADQEPNKMCYYIGGPQATCEKVKQIAYLLNYQLCTVNQMPDMMRALSRVFGWEYDEIPQLNVAPAEDLAEANHLATEYGDLVRKINAEDVQLFNWLQTRNIVF